MEIIKSIENELKGKTLEICSLNKEKTALITIDMVNGFVYSGALSSPRVASIVNNIVEINKYTEGFKKVFFVDSHHEYSTEFNNFPKHCVKSTDEADIIPELKPYLYYNENAVCIEKNSTNGFNSKEFKHWLSKNMDEIDNYIVVGCVTDICILQFALSIKAYFNEENKNKRIIVPINAVDTYDGGTHNGYLMNLFALYNMYTCGIEVVDKIN